MKISMVIPRFLSGTSFLQQPLDMLYSASILEQNGHSVNVIDARALACSLDDVVNLSRDSEVIIVSTTPYDQVQNYFVDYRYSYTVTTINYIKEQIPNALLIICGSHGTVRPDLLMKDINADIIIQGECEYTILKIIEVYINNDKFDIVPNIMYKDSDKYIITRRDKELWHPTFDNNLLPAYDKINMDLYFGDTYCNNIPIRKKKWCVMQGSRGCPYSCSFCYNFWGKQVRYRSPESIVEEMKLLENKYNIEEIFFIDFTFTLNRDWVKNICNRIINEGLKIKWTVETRCDLVDKDLVQHMANANCSSIWLGIESFDDSILKINNKQITSEKITHSIYTIKEVGIEPHAFIMIGMQGETIDTLNKTIREVYKIKIPYTKSIITCGPRFGTEYYDVAKKQYSFLGEYWQDLSIIKGQVNNEMNPFIIQSAINIMSNRNFVNETICPQINI